MKFVLKVSGKLLTAEEVILPEAVKVLTEKGAKVVIVHGGGPQLTAMLQKLGKVPQFVDGLRVTPKEEMEIVEMVLSGFLNKMLVGTFLRHGVPACGISGRDAFFLQGQRYVLKKDGHEIDLGQVGDVTRVDTRILFTLWESGFVPIVSPVCGDGSWEALNVNADWVAAHIARALRADYLLLFSDVPGVLRDPENRDTLLETLTLKEMEDLLAKGTVRGGMVPKLQVLFQFLRGSVREVFISEGSEVVHLPALCEGGRIHGTRIIL
ncbi:MAG: acetylglutamate kinase [Candidatus Caldatribacterium sp.]|uniref:acetylglutamate kinase n=1 Tax=Candidatus Caldatribacterium sp. TaxID=2282143 RepID=UPI0029940911|nr:acetylglutamate kinase [Candidatus Caldatribacterium sp.]MCX7729598.1 acetylglutamate kinase [Candidatus Caldatribacterium sp.]MDW8080723.1 acetylglutamate kinase [Candidatus Calescibacterium sp.]